MTEINDNDGYDNLNHLVKPKGPSQAMMAFVGIVILLAGVTIGAALTFIVFKPHKPDLKGVEFIRERAVRHLEHDLELTEEQKSQIDASFKKHLMAMDAIREKARPQIEKELVELDKDVKSVLDKQQQDKWDENVKKMNKRFSRRRRDGRGKRKRNDRDDNSVGPPPPPPDEEFGNDRNDGDLKQDKKGVDVDSGQRLAPLPNNDRSVKD